MRKKKKKKRGFTPKLDLILGFTSRVEPCSKEFFNGMYSNTAKQKVPRCHSYYGFNGLQFHRLIYIYISPLGCVWMFGFVFDF